MSWNPLNTLTGRLVLVTIVAVIISYLTAFLLFSNERGSALRRAAEAGVVERIVYAVERLREAPPQQRDLIAEQSRGPGIRYSISAAPLVAQTHASSSAVRIAREISRQLSGADVRVDVRTTEELPRRWRRRGVENDVAASEGRSGPLVRVRRALISVQLSDGSWLNARARLPRARPAPVGLLVGALISILVVGAGAALVARQVGRPLADLAEAARTLGSGQAHVSAPVQGPADVRRASMAFNAMADRLGRQLQRQRQMLWALSHDLRTPITALRLRAELIEDEGARQRLLAPIEEMEQLTEQALALARAGASEEPRAQVDLAEIARTLCGELRELGLNVRAEAAQPLMVECRPSEVARALRNLAENAAKYAGGGVMRVFRSENGDAVAEVLDEGPGVPPDMLARLATPFFRLDTARSQSNGAGLGLAIAQAIADGHGGRLELANRTPHGLSARLILPADRTRK